MRPAISWRRLISAAFAGAFAVSGPAAAQDRPLGPEDLTVVAKSFATSLSGLHALLEGCAADKPAHWDDAKAMIVATMRKAGVADGDVAAIAAALETGSAPACDSDVARALLSSTQPTDWVDFSRDAFAHVGIEFVTQAAGPDARLEAVRALIGEQIGDQARMLRCLSLAEVRFFPTAYADWEGVVDRVDALLARAGYADAVIADTTAPARARVLFVPAVDRDAELAACVANSDWMTRYAMLGWFTLPGDVEKALETAQ